MKKFKAKIDAWFKGAQMGDKVKVYGKDIDDIIIQKAGANEMRLYRTKPRSMAGSAKT